MTKVIFPEKGLMQSQLKNIESLEASFQKIKNKTFPSSYGFDGSDYIAKLPEKIENLYKQFESVKSDFQMTDDNFLNLANKITEEFKTIKPNKMSKRNKII